MQRKLSMNIDSGQKYVHFNCEGVSGHTCLGHESFC